MGGDLAMITRICYCTRDDVKTAIDFKESARQNSQVDRAIQSAADNIEGFTLRKFWPLAATRVFDWPNYQRSYPWRLWLDQHELISVSVLSSGGVVIPAGQYFLEPANSGPPYTRIDLNRATSAAWTSGATPQHAISVTGVFGFSADTAPAGALTAAMTDTTGTVAAVTNSALAGAGSLLLVDGERMLVTDQAMTATGQAQLGAGAGTAVASDVALTVADGTKFATGETVLLDSERMRIVDVAGNVLTVKRAWDGTVLATHSGAAVYAPRLLTVTRGAAGTTAATHLTGAAAAVNAPPSLVRDLAIAEAANQVLQESGGYAQTTGEGDTAHAAPGAGLAEKWDEVVTKYRRNRTGAI